MITLTNIDSDFSDKGGHPPLGIGYIASYIKQYGIDDVSIVDKENNPLKAIKKHNPDMLGFSSTTPDFPNAVRLAKDAKEELDIPIIIGGQHITLLKRLPDSFDVGVIGEGEETMKELTDLYVHDGELKKEKLKDIKGIIFHDNDKLIMTEPRPLIEPLDKIPFPARDLFNMNEYLSPRKSITSNKLNRGTHMFTSRGCPFSCAFCSSSKFWKKIRYNSPEYAVKEITYLKEKYKVDGLLIFDDLFVGNKERLKKIVELLDKEKIELEYRCYTRVNFIIDDEVCRLLKRMGVVSVSLGFESGSQKILNYLNKKTTVRMNEKAIENCKKYGFHIHGCFILGTPTETREDMMMTLKFIKDNPIIDEIDLTIMTPYPETRIWDYAKQKGLVSDDMDFSILKTQPKDLSQLILLNDMDTNEFKELYKMTLAEVNKRSYNISIK
ncbi:MAG: radical SAM protein, partial [Candidatus Aenigmarchaeota archaeon]|nr:radical SAM protein [Candidatus Aenigmarchaeota archaeon]